MRVETPVLIKEHNSEGLGDWVDPRSKVPDVICYTKAFVCNDAIRQHYDIPGDAKIVVVVSNKPIVGAIEGMFSTDMGAFNAMTKLIATKLGRRRKRVWWWVELAGKVK